MLFFCSIRLLQSHGDWKKNYPVHKASKIKKISADAKPRGRQQSHRASGKLANEELGDSARLQGRQLGFTPGGFQAAEVVGLAGGSWAGQNTAWRCHTENNHFFLFFL